MSFITPEAKGRLTDDDLRHLEDPGRRRGKWIILGSESAVAIGALGLALFLVEEYSADVSYAALISGSLALIIQPLLLHLISRAPDKAWQFTSLRASAAILVLAPVVLLLWVSAGTSSALPATLLATLWASLATLVLSRLWLGQKVRSSELRSELSASLDLECQSMAFHSPGQPGTSFNDQVARALRLIAIAALASPWSRILRRILPHRAHSVTAGLFVFNPQTDEIEPFDIQVAGATRRDDALSELRDEIVSRYRPAKFDLAWYQEALTQCNDAQDRIRCVRERRDRRSKVSTIGASFLSGKSYYSESPARCMTFDSTFLRHLGVDVLRRFPKRLRRHFLFQSMVTLPVFGIDYDEPIAVVAVASPRTRSFSLDDQVVLSRMVRFLGVAMQLGEEE